MANANIHYLSDRLEKFRTGVGDNLSSMSSKASELSTGLNDAALLFESALNGVSSAWTDSNSAATKSVLELIMQAAKRLKDTVDGDLTGCLGKCNELMTEINNIVALYNSGQNLRAEEWVDGGLLGVIEFSGQWFDGKVRVKNDQDQINALNKKIDKAIHKAEAMLDAIISSMQGITLGIVGNMVPGGALGAYTAMNYQFNYTPPAEERDTTGIPVLSWAASFVVGGVEAICKIGEGIVDAVGTAAAAVVSGVGTVLTWVGADGAGEALHNASDAISNAVAYDAVGTAFDYVYDGMSSIGLYNETAANVGNFTGTVVGHAVLWCLPGGALLSAAATAGNAAETSLQSGDAIGVALLKGAATGAFSYGVGKLLPAVTSKVGSWANNVVSGATKSNVVGRVVAKGITTTTNAVGKYMTWSSKASVLNPLAAPGKIVTGLGNVVNKTAGVLNKGIQGNALASKAFGALQSADDAIVAGAKNVATNVANKASNIAHNVSDKVHSGIDKARSLLPGHKGVTTAGGVADDVVAGATNNAGNVVAQNADDVVAGATNNAGNVVAQNNATVSPDDFGNLGMPGMTDDAAQLSYNEALSTARHATPGSAEHTDAFTKLADTYGNGRGGTNMNAPNAFNNAEQRAAYYGKQIVNGTATPMDAKQYTNAVYEIAYGPDFLEDFYSQAYDDYMQALANSNPVVPTPNPVVPTPNPIPMPGPVNPQPVVNPTDPATINPLWYGVVAEETEKMST